MENAATFSGVRPRRSFSAGAFFAPSDLSDLALVQTLASFSRDLVTSHSSPVTSFPLQRKNARSLVLRVRVLLSLFEFLVDSRSPAGLPSSAKVCLKELYILIYRSRHLLDYCSEGSRLLVLLQNPQISANFHDLNQDVATILDVLPIGGLGLGSDLREQVQLLQRQARLSKLYVDPEDELLRLQVVSFLDEFGGGRTPARGNLEFALINRLGIKDAQTCRSEIDFLEEQIFNNDEDAAVGPSVLGGVIALTRYCRFLLFDLAEESRGLKSRAPPKKIGDVSVTIPKDFCCPISLDLMQDPVIISTGQTYDRSSISQWIEEGHNTCPSSGQILAHTQLIPNKALRTLISQWCAAQRIHYEPAVGSDALDENVAAASSSRAAIEANRATSGILVGKLVNGSEDEITTIVKELRLLAKNGDVNRACIGEQGAIPLLQKLLSSSNPKIQENSVTAMLNLSILDKNKTIIMEEEGCLRSVIGVLRNASTMEARENAAATLFSLSSAHNLKRRIVDEPNAVEALSELLRNGSVRGKKDAVAALFNLSTDPECCVDLMESGAIWSLVQALATEEISEEASGALALLVRQRTVAEIVGRDDVAVKSLVTLMKRGSPKSKENAVATLHEICKNGGGLTRKIAKTPAVRRLIQTLLLTGTKRARRKAASLVKMCQRSEMAVSTGGEHAMRQNSSFAGGDVSVSVAVSVL
ncbi:uncharacterized protein A4U43_C01F34680 [Asparagus officinalis]|uniref:RING-type E3 ubiquitin transferase n=1 Tax=Asparagus officinalis TaxID=4686 RepID=A0A5P1FXL8_ASPOF|nr:U-box domain-containing protein 17-like [Asparagus officinalis]ONK81960.1 uncharacterized protein A4U43_C01F34680 [Asparagus officinalis]